MVLYANEKLVSIHNRYNILDGNKKIIYQVQSKPISLGKKTSVYDKDNNLVIYASQELFHLTNTYNVYIRDKFAFKMKQLFKLFNISFELSNGYSVKGDFLSLEFNILDENKKEIANVTRKFISVGDKYQINIHDDEKMELVLAIVTVITNVIDATQDLAANTNN